MIALTRPKTLRERITQQQIDDLWNRRISTNQLAKDLGVSANYLCRRYPGRSPQVPSISESFRRSATAKRQLKQARDQFRVNLLLEAQAGTITMVEAATRAHCTVRTLYRLRSKYL